GWGIGVLSHDIATEYILPVEWGVIHMKDVFGGDIVGEHADSPPGAEYHDGEEEHRRESHRSGLEGAIPQVAGEGESEDRRDSDDGVAHRGDETRQGVRSDNVGTYGCDSRKGRALEGSE